MIKATKGGLNLYQEYQDSATTRTTRIMLVDDHPIVINGLRTELSRYSYMDICGEATTGKEGIMLANSLLPDVVVLDLRLPDMHGLAVAEEICRADAAGAVLIFSMCDQRDMIPH